MKGGRNIVVGSDIIIRKTVPLLRKLNILDKNCVLL